LLHHIDLPALSRSFFRQKRQAGAGVDGVTVADYERDLQDCLRDLHTRIHRGSYRPHPVRRSYIPKPDGGSRPIGIPALEDKIVQGAVAELLSTIYEVDFRNFSYGFRPGWNPHQALDALHTGLMTQRVNWVLDADIRSFFDSVDHGMLLRMLDRRIGDRRIIELIKRWLKAGVMENGQRSDMVEGTPQGAGISPLLANVFLHYALDLWVSDWRRTKAAGRVIFVRYADDFVLGFQRKQDALRFQAELRDRLREVGLRLNEDKTRLLSFGAYAKPPQNKLGRKRPETFDFLGFTHYCGTSRNGRHVVKRKTQRKRLHKKLKALRTQLKAKRHRPVIEQWRWLCSVLKGHYNYYGLPSNIHSLQVFRHQVLKAWIKWLRRRSQKNRRNWKQFYSFIDSCFPLPQPRITHPR
jgi:group II intron reverse transcriptase/maturase